MGESVALLITEASMIPIFERNKRPEEVLLVLSFGILGNLAGRRPVESFACTDRYSHLALSTVALLTRTTYVANNVCPYVYAHKIIRHWQYSQTHSAKRTQNFNHSTLDELGFHRTQRDIRRHCYCG